jgi:hypothetical protein
MSWGATAFTPIITYNHPPFGFEERPNPSDYPTCPENPYVGAENIKQFVKKMTKNDEDFAGLEGFSSERLNSANILLILIILVAIVWYCSVIV